MGGYAALQFGLCYPEKLARLSQPVLTLDRDGRAWRDFDWSVMNRLHDKGMIHNPAGKPKSVLPTEEGIAESERLFREMFAKTI
jgi:hypothetical protein